MKKTVILLPAIFMLLWVSTGAVSKGQDYNYEEYLSTDSAYVYKWNFSMSDWELSQVQLYIYNDGKLAELLTKDIETGAALARSDYLYNESGRIEVVTNYNYEGSWVLSNRAIYEYDYLGRISSVRVQKWIEDALSEDRLQQNYVYDINNKLTGYETIYWRFGAWTMPTVSVLYYNDLGQLESRVATRPNGNIDYRIIYEYNDRGQQTQYYTQYPEENGWSNWNLRTIQYNNCDGKASQIQYSGEGPAWNPSTKTVFFYSFDPVNYAGKKVPVCHKGHTIWIAVQAVPAHLRHGDCIGECVSERLIPGGKSDLKPPFTVYPNPAQERFTVRFQGHYENGDRRVELTDYTGNLIKAFTVRDNSDLVIERGRLKPGNYFIRLVGNEVYSLMVVFE